MLKNTHTVLNLHFTNYNNTKFAKRKVNEC